MNRFRIMDRFRFIGSGAVVVVGLGGALLGLGAGAVPAAVAATMVAVGGDHHGRPEPASARPGSCGPNRRPSLPATAGCGLSLAQTPAGLRAAVRRDLRLPPASARGAVQQAKLTAADGAAGDQFGLAVAISGSTAVVGAPFKNSETGAAYVFVRSGTTWSQQAKLTIAHSGAGTGFGWSVALSGATLVVGAPGQALGTRITGAAYVFSRSGTTWSQQAKLTAPVHSPVSDDLGWSVALSGPTAVVGDPRNNSFTGAAFVFVRSGTTWSRQAKLTAAAHGFQQFLGQSVAVSGNTVVAGAPATGTAYVFTRSGTTWSRQAKLAGAVGSFGSSVALSITPATSTTAVVGAPGKNANTGAAFVFVRSGTTWSRQATLTAAHGTANDGFGSSVALCGPTVVVGAPGAAAAYVFTRSGTTWSQHAKLTAAAAQFGDSVALYGSAAVVGAPGKNANTGAAYVFQKA